MVKLILILITGLLIAILAGAESPPQDRRMEKDCTAVNLTAPLGSNRKQGDIGWCYANAAADLLTYRYQQELRGQRVSAGYIALAFNNKYFQRANFDGGMAFLALFTSYDTGLCPALEEETLLSRGPQLSFKQRLNQLIRLKHNYDKSHKASLERDLADFYASTGSVLTTMPKADLIEILDHSTEFNFPKHFADYFCQGQKIHIQSRVIPTVDSKYFHWGDTEPLLRKIHQQLDSENIVGAAYFADFFDQDNAPNTDSGRHVSVIAGRQWNKSKNQCELLIRNSYGEGCSYRAKSLQEPGVCVKGNLWVSENLLARVLYGITYLEQN